MTLKSFLLSAYLGGLTAHASTSKTATPVVIWHGMGDSCCLPFSMGRVKSEIESAAVSYGQQIFVHSVMIGIDPMMDQIEGFFGNMNSQVESTCKQLAAIPELANGFNAIGFSQGGQLLRAYVQRCNKPAVKNLITFGAQHMGVSETPGCVGENSGLCQQMAEILGHGAYLPGVRDISIQAQYFRAPMLKDQYIAHNIFLPDINNEKPATSVVEKQKQRSYKDNLASLDRLVLIKFTEDTVVVPRESSWFGTYPWGSLDDDAKLKYNETDIYKGDSIGLKTLDQAGKLIFKECHGNHMQFTMKYLKEEVVVPYLLDGTKELKEEIYI